MDNAAARKNFASDLYESAVKQEKELILNTFLTEEHARLHRSGAIHLHDLEGYRHVYNCCTPSLTRILNVNTFSAENNLGYIIEIFEKIKNLIANLSICQTGGIGFANFDNDIARVLNQLNIDYNPITHEIMTEVVKTFISWINNTRGRYCREPYYVSLNIGLSTSVWGRAVTNIILNTYITLGVEIIRPNIIFKVKKNINGQRGTVNYDLFLLALQCTAKKMIPTYLLMDSSVNVSCCSEKLGIMGCRTRVYQNINGEEGVIGRGNLACVSINLPRIALTNKNVKDFEFALYKMALLCKEILLTRMQQLLKSKDIEFVFSNHLWGEISSIKELSKQGTLAIGFIGLSETVEILLGAKMHISKEAEKLGFHIISTLRKYVDQFREETKMNFSLLATPGEMISGKFAAADKNSFFHKTSQKGFYTNSFHVEVDSSLSLYKKIRIEGKFHTLCNGGCISYVEFNDAPINNIEALEDLVNYAENNHISYLGFNFPLDICMNCDCHGTFDDCPRCGSDNIKRIRRVSGYLEDLNYFTKGKFCEVNYRRANI